MKSARATGVVGCRAPIRPGWATTEALCGERVPALMGPSAWRGGVGEAGDRDYFSAFGRGSLKPLLPRTPAGLLLESPGPPGRRHAALSPDARPRPASSVSPGSHYPASPLPLSASAPALSPSLRPPRDLRPLLARGSRLRGGLRPAPPPRQPFVSRRNISWVAERLGLRVPPRPASSTPGSAPPAVSPPLPPRRPSAP